MNVAEIKDPKVRRRVEEADQTQNQRPSTPHPQPLSPVEAERVAPSKAKSKKRLRQSSKPLMNVLEADFLAHLELSRRGGTPLPYDGTRIQIQAKRYRLGNGIWYKPDFTVSRWPVPAGRNQPGQYLMRETAWEVKGPKVFRGGFENLKVAASLYPEVRWLLVWKDKKTGEWREQEMIP